MPNISKGSLPIVICIFLMTACKARDDVASTKSNPEAKIPFGSVDSPRTGSEVRGKVHFGGWALAEGGIAHVAIYIDRSFVTYATTGGDRPDVAKVFANFTDSPKAGWNTIIDMSAIPEGPREVVVQVRSNAGAYRDLAKLELVVRR